MALHSLTNDTESSNRPTGHSFDFHVAPGHLIRRAQQTAVALFFDELSEMDITPIQFAFLSELSHNTDIDQVTLAAHIAIDVATLGQVARRLEARQLVRRTCDCQDRRKKRLEVSAKGKRLLMAALPRVQAAQQRILAPLSEAEKKRFLDLLERVIGGNHAASRVASIPTQYGNV